MLSGHSFRNALRICMMLNLLGVFEIIYYSRVQLLTNALAYPRAYIYWVGELDAI